MIANDTDVDGDDLDVLSVDTTGTQGTVVIDPMNPDQVLYDPNGQFEDLGVGETATDTFTYTVTDGNGGTDTATVTVTITGGNEPPVAAPDSTTVGEDDAATPINVIANDTDVDGDDLDVLTIDTTGTEGTVVIDPMNPDQVLYDPNGQFEDLGVGETATDTFTYTVTDGNGGTDTATVTVTITGANDDPVAEDDSASTGAETPTTINLTANDTDPDVNDDLEILTIDTTGTQGTVTINPDDDSVNYDPNGAFVGLADGETATDTFTYTVTDGNGGTDTCLLYTSPSPRDS